MQLEHIREFLKLVEVRKYRQVAEQFAISSSALTKHIRMLEDELGYTLFDRTTRSVVLTAQGRVFAEYARKMINLDEECRIALDYSANAHNDGLTVGFGDLSGFSSVDHLLYDFSKHSPSTEMTVIKDNDVNLYDSLKTGKCDIIILREPVQKSISYPYITVETEYIAVMEQFRPGKTVSGTKPIESLKKEGFIMPSRNSNLYNAFTEECQKAGFVPRIELFDPTPRNRMLLAAQDVGMAVDTIPDGSFGIHKGALSHLVTPAIEFETRIYYQEENGHPTGKFIDYVISALASRITL